MRWRLNNSSPDAKAARDVPQQLARPSFTPTCYAIEEQHAVQSEEQPDMLPIAVQQLSDSSDAVKEKAAILLRNYAEAGPSCADQVVWFDGAVAGLVAHLDNSNTAAVQQEAVTTLATLAEQCTDSIEITRQAPSAVTGLVALLANADVQQQAAHALGCLAQGTPANQDSVAAEPGAIEGLVGLLSSDRVDVQRTVAWALAQLADGSTDNSKRICQERQALINRLVDQISSSSAGRQAARGLANLADGSWGQNTRDIVAYKKGEVITCLSALLSSDKAEVQQAAAWALGKLMNGSCSISRRFGQERKAIQRLVDLLSSSKADVREAAAFAMVAAAAPDSSSPLHQTIELHSAAVWPALCSGGLVTRLTTEECADLAHALYTLAAATKSIKLSMAVSWELFMLLKQLQQQQLQGCSATGILVANAALELLDNGESVLLHGCRKAYVCRGWQLLGSVCCTIMQICCCWAT